MSNPIIVIREAIKNVPFAKYALGVAGIASALAIIKSFNLKNSDIPIIGIGVMFIFMVLLYVFSVLSNSSDRHIKNAGYILVYSTVIITCLSALLLASSLFFKWPLKINGTADCNENDIIRRFNNDFPQYDSDYSEFVIDIDGDNKLDIIKAGPQKVFVHLGKKDCGYSNFEERVETIYDSENQTSLYLNYDISFYHNNRDGIIDIKFTAKDDPSKIFVHLGRENGEFDTLDTRIEL